jgi:hypothetical protein
MGNHATVVATFRPTRNSARIFRSLRIHSRDALLRDSPRPDLRLTQTESWFLEINPIPAPKEHDLLVIQQVRCKADARSLCNESSIAHSSAEDLAVFGILVFGLGGTVVARVRVRVFRFLRLQQARYSQSVR